MNNNIRLSRRWEVTRFMDVLDYIQPTNYIVNSTDYDNNYKTPVLTAGKSFIIGYTNEITGIFSDVPVIIFDDFTTATKFVNFPFKVKSSAMKILRSKNNNLNIKFAYYFMQTIRIQSETHKRYWISDYSKLCLPLPSPPEQKQIVDKIEELFSELDAGRRQLETAKEQLRTYRQAVLKYAFEGKLTIGTINEVEWRQTKFGNIINEFVRGPFGSSLKKEFFTQEGYKVYEQKNAIYQSVEIGNYFVSDEKFQELKRYELKPKDFIVSCSGTIGRLFQMPETAPKGLINQALLIMRINRELVLDKYFRFLFTFEGFQKKIIKDAKGTAMLNLAGVKEMKEVPVILPPIKDQNQLVQIIEVHLSVCDKIEDTIDSSLNKSEALKQAILKLAFEGKLVKPQTN